MHDCNSVGKPSLDPTHVDYIPTLFSFTSEERRTVLEKRAKNHKRLVSIKKKRLQRQKKAPVRITVEPSVEQEITSVYNAEIDGDDLQQTEVCHTNVEQLQAANIVELENDDGGSVPQCSEHVVEDNMLLNEVFREIEELKACLAERQARCMELERVTVEFLNKQNDAQAKIKELDTKNANLEAENVELKEKIEELHVQQQKDVFEAEVVKDMEKKITELESKCISVNALKDNGDLVKFYTGLPDYDTLKAVF